MHIQLNELRGAAEQTEAAAEQVPVAAEYERADMDAATQGEAAARADIERLEHLLK